MKKYLFIITILFPVMLFSCKDKGKNASQEQHISFTVDALDTPKNWQWRGENRNGVYNETGLLKEWPDEGPQLLWSFTGLGEGHTSVAIANGKIYVNGMHEDRLILYVFDMAGKLLTEKEIGTEWNKNWNGARSSVCVMATH